MALRMRHGRVRRPLLPPGVARQARGRQHQAELLVERRRRDELGVRPDTDHAAVIQHHDDIRVDDGREPVRDDQQGAILGDRVDGLAQELLIESVERGGRLIQEQNRRGGQQGARDREALTLAAREHHARLADGSVEPELAAFEHLVEVHRVQHVDARLVGGLR